jgi:GTP-binding protein HflX
VLLSDTVGFIRDLPHHLVASFKSTLEEARQARLLLHVVDASNQQAEQQIQAVNKVLQELGCAGKPTLLVLNKIDRLKDRSYLDVLQSQHRHTIAVSAATGQGLEALADAVIEALSADFVDVEVEMDAANGRVHAYLSAHAEIYRQHYENNRMLLRCYVPKHLVHHIQEPDVQVRLLTNGLLDDKSETRDPKYE